jgi:hypothetical protein
VKRDSKGRPRKTLRQAEEEHEAPPEAKVEPASLEIQTNPPNSEKGIGIEEGNGPMRLQSMEVYESETTE